MGLIEEAETELRDLLLAGLSMHEAIRRLRTQGFGLIAIIKAIRIVEGVGLKEAVELVHEQDSGRA